MPQLFPSTVLCSPAGNFRLKTHGPVGELFFVTDAALTQVEDAPRHYFAHDTGIGGPNTLASGFAEQSQASSRAAASTVTASGSKTVSRRIKSILPAIRILPVRKSGITTRGSRRKFT
jgi:hypothetical protein